MAHEIMQRNDILTKIDYKCYNAGMDILYECWDEINIMNENFRNEIDDEIDDELYVLHDGSHMLYGGSHMLYGGSHMLYGGSNALSSVATKSIMSRITSKLFSEQTRIVLIRLIRGVTRAGAGVAADIFTVGAGGDVAVDSIFAVQSSSTFIGNIADFISIANQARELFDELIFINTKMKIPIISRLDLDDGFQSFELKFNKILINYVTKHGTKLLTKIHAVILRLLQKITSTIADWIACLFPDTAGLAGEISKTLLDYITNNGFNYIYNLVGIMPDNLQKMVTNSFALKKLIHDSVSFLRSVINLLSPDQMSKIVEVIGMKAGDFASSGVVKGAISIGTGIATHVTKYAFGAASLYTSKIPQAKDIIIYVIDKFITPHIDAGVELFVQLFPIFLMFTLFLQKYPDIIKMYPHQ